ncbi:N-alpha-acetyltransferase 20 isoform X1 [Equus caballus]|uniref:N-alpha-acetyltransferase 20 n=2 Tax=Equus TaxID=9789 RepID=A0A9L0TSI7_HORSE|nr:N-alpha-acetyltransferase 20 isoform X1 [Equus caballus]
MVRGRRRGGRADGPADLGRGAQACPAAPRARRRGAARPPVRARRARGAGERPEPPAGGRSAACGPGTPGDSAVSSMWWTLQARAAGVVASNLDPLTETYGIPFYLQYLAHWPEYFIVAEAPGGELMGYIMGKAEGSVAREEWHGHVTALSVAPEFRRLGLAAKLMELLEEISERKGGFFVDLFVRVSNQVAVNMYKQLGYSVYRTVIEYYSASNGEPDEDAYDMRKALSRDTEKKSIIPLPHPVRPEDIE